MINGVPAARHFAVVAQGAEDRCGQSRFECRAQCGFTGFDSRGNPQTARLIAVTPAAVQTPLQAAITLPRHRYRGTHSCFFVAAAASTSHVSDLRPSSPPRRTPSGATLSIFCPQGTKIYMASLQATFEAPFLTKPASPQAGTTKLESLAPTSLPAQQDREETFI